MTAPLHPALALLFSPAGGTNPVMGQLFMYGAIFLIFYFFLLRPQTKQRRDHESLIRSLKKGDEVVTAGGIIGEVVHIKESTKDGAPVKTMDDRITIKSGDTRLIVERGRITRIVSSAGGASGTTSGSTTTSA